MMSPNMALKQRTVLKNKNSFYIILIKPSDMVNFIKSDKEVL